MDRKGYKIIDNPAKKTPFVSFNLYIRGSHRKALRFCKKCNHKLLCKHCDSVMFDNSAIVKI